MGNNNNHHHHCEEKRHHISVLCPLAGDDPFIFLLYQKGYSVTAIDIVEDAINALKQRFDQGSPDTTNTTTAAADATSCCWTKTHEPDGDLIWKHRNGRVTFIVGDVTKPRPAFVNSFDAVYDKDSFGALPMTVRPAFCHRMLEYTKDRAILYLECKVKPGHHNATTADTMGPPYSLRYEDIMPEPVWRAAASDYRERVHTLLQYRTGPDPAHAPTHVPTNTATTTSNAAAAATSNHTVPYRTPHTHRSTYRPYE